PGAKAGVVEAIAGEVPLSEALWRDPTTHMHFLPAVGDPLSPSPADVFGSSAAKSLFVALEANYDYIIVDLPPPRPPSAVRAISALIDGYMLVIEWGRTKIDAVQYALRHTPGVQESILGAILNKVDVDVMSRYDKYGAQYYYSRSGYGGRRN